MSHISISPTIGGSSAASLAPSTEGVAAGRARREALFRGMRRIDLSSNRNVPLLMEMVGAISRATEPQEVLKRFADGIYKLHGPRGYISLSTRGLKPGEYRITRLLVDPDALSRIPLATPWEQAQSLPIHTGGFLGELIRSAYPELIHDLNVTDDPVLGDALAPFKCMMAIPLFDNGEPLNWSIVLGEEADAFSIEELEHTILRANLVGNTVRTTLITKQLREANERARREVEQIAKIQRSLLPQHLPSLPGLNIATSYETFDTAGGDLYDFRLLRANSETHLLRIDTESRRPHPDDTLAILIADASGHGPSAAVVSAMLNAILYAYPGGMDGPAALLDHANRHLCAKRLEGIFVTAFLAAYNPMRRTLTYARAGHPPPILMTRADRRGLMRLDAVGGIPLGIMHEVMFEESTVILEPGHTLVLYTDGVTEAQSPQGRMFGVGGIEHALEACTGEPSCVITSINTSLRAHEAGARPQDDQTIVAMKVEK